MSNSFWPFPDGKTDSKGRRRATAASLSAESAFHTKPAVHPDIETFTSAKRVFDIIVVTILAPVAAAIVAVAGLLILIKSGRPVFFIQARVGLNGREFRMIKLRTMEPAEDSQAITATVFSDPRITPLGRFLRKYRIDELPQLLNVLKGDMSLIGPRPEQPALVEHYRAVMVNYDARHRVRPGITGWAQVMHGYTATVEETRIKLIYDHEYVDRASLLLDAEILARTFFTIVLARGAR